MTLSILQSVWRTQFARENFFLSFLSLSLPLRHVFMMMISEYLSFAIPDLNESLSSHLPLNSVAPCHLICRDWTIPSHSQCFTSWDWLQWICFTWSHVSWRVSEDLASCLLICKMKTKQKKGVVRAGTKNSQSSQRYITSTPFQSTGRCVSGWLTTRATLWHAAFTLKSWHNHFD